MGFKGKEGEGKIELDQVEGREIACKLQQAQNVGKTAQIQKFTKVLSFPSF